VVGGSCKFREAERPFQEREGRRMARKCIAKTRDRIYINVFLFTLGKTCSNMQRDLAALIQTPHVPTLQL